MEDAPLLIVRQALRPMLWNPANGPAVVPGHAGSGKTILLRWWVDDRGIPDPTWDPDTMGFVAREG